ncbi:unnamed protein product [Mytilus coruscus]|uniref:Myb/SANT-like DNA-binding domain-containing protein n=1 Tax=Mytilus coruscus TaxID=42192 RepID=A0A6J8BHC9_MYTCO|nr:unnamed protein product [Mytilus coruscus]
MTSFTSGSRKKQVRFQSKDYLVLLREVLARNPFKNKSAWNEIALSVADTRSNFQSSSGIDEEYGEKETLLDEINSFIGGGCRKTERKREREKGNRRKSGKDIRKRAMENLTPKKEMLVDQLFESPKPNTFFNKFCLYISSDDESNDATPSKRNSSGNIVGYLKEKNEAEMVYRRQELEVKKQQLQLEEDKIQLEKQERIQKLENDKQEKTLMLELLKKCLGDRN